MKTETEHTPTPWEWGTNFASEEYSPNGVVIRPKNEFPHGRWVADLGRTYDEEAKANAEFIVRAVNAHDELVALLKDVICPIAEALPQQAPDPDAFVKWQLSFLKRAHEAISKAEGHQ